MKRWLDALAGPLLVGLCLHVYLALVVGLTALGTLYLGENAGSALLVAAILVFLAVRLIGWLDATLLARGHASRELGGPIAVLLCVTIPLSVLGVPLTNGLQQALAYQDLSPAEAARSWLPGRVDLHGTVIRAEDSEPLCWTGYLKHGTAVRVCGAMTPVRDAAGVAVAWVCSDHRIGSSGAPAAGWLVPPGRGSFASLLGVQPARDRRPPEWRDRCVELELSPSREWTRWFAGAVLLVAEALVWSVALRLRRPRRG